MTPIDLKAALAERRKSALDALRIPVCLSRDLVDEFEELAAQRAEIVAPFEMRRQRAARSDDARMGDDMIATSALIDAEQAAATAEIDARLAEVQELGAQYTVTLVFSILPPSKYQEMANTYIPLGSEDATDFSRALTAATYRGVQQGNGPIDSSTTWADFSEPPAGDPESPADTPAPPAALSFGEVDRIAMQVFRANRGTVASPFSRKSSASSR